MLSNVLSLTEMEPRKVAPRIIREIGWGKTAVTVSPTAPRVFNVETESQREAEVQRESERHRARETETDRQLER